MTLLLLGLLAPIVTVAAFAWWLGFQERAMRLIVLELLRDGIARGGLELVQMSNGRLLRGLIYNVLHGLQDAGLVDSIVEAGPIHPARGGIPRRLYFLTERGLARAADLGGGSP